MKLYYSPGACSLAPHIAIHEAGLSFEGEKVDLRKKQFSGGDYSQVNPKGSVPVIELDDHSFLTENAVILQYIADQKPEAKLIPKPGTIDRYRAQEWLNYLATEVHKTFSPLWNPNLDETARAKQQETLATKFNYLAKHLSTNQFIAGNQYSVADAYLFTLISWTKPLKIDLTKWPDLMSYFERISNRPATQKAMKEEGLIH